MLWILIALLLAAIALVGYLLYRRRRSVPARTARRCWGKQFVVHDPEGSCAQARALNGRCLPLGQVPEVPLPGCTRSRCTCQLRDLVDRRSGWDRRSGKDRRSAIRFEDNADRRSGKERRGTHYDWRNTP